MRTRRASGAGAMTCAGEAAAITPTVNQFNLPSGGSVPLGLTTGSDGNLWFTDPAFTPQIGQLNPDTHAAVEFGQADGLQANSVPRQIAPGRDGNLWFTDSGCAGIGACEIGTINPTTHAITEFSAGLNLGASPEGIAAGPDDNLWFTDRGTPNAIGSINPSTHAIAEFSTGLESGDDPGAITAGSDGNLWFTDAGSTITAIGTINPGTHTITKFGQANGLNAGSIPRAITAGPDGNLWFADAGVTPAIGTINPTTHAITEFSAGLNPGSAPNFIAAGPDGDLWFTDNGSTNAIGRIDPRTGAIAEFSKDVDQSGSGPVGITAGPDGNMWFADRGTPSSIVRVTTPPTAETISAHPTGATSATVSGKADGHAQPTSFAIEFGPVGAPTAKTPDQSLGTMSGVTAVSTALGGLRPKTAYRARVIVTNPTDTTAGAFLTFMTPQAPPPNTRITKKKISSRRHRATLVFRAIGTASSFQCKLRRARAHKKAKFRPCRSPKTYKHLRAGRYTFSVRAIGPGGRDLSPAKAKFKIKPE